MSTSLVTALAKLATALGRTDFSPEKISMPNPACPKVEIRAYENSSLDGSLSLLEDRERSSSALFSSSRGGLSLRGSSGDGSRYRPPKNRELARQWSGSGSVPPSLRKHFTQGELAVASFEATETKRFGICTKPIWLICKIVGVCRTTVQNYRRKARKLKLTFTQWGKFKASRTWVVSKDWLAWIKRGSAGKHLGPLGLKIPNPTESTLRRKTTYRGVAATKEATKSSGENVAPWDLVPT